MSKLAVAVKTYIFKKEGTSILKIGRTRDLEKRLRVLTTSSGCNLEVVAIFYGDIEKLLHYKFSHLRTIGEWFDDMEGEIENLLNNELESLTAMALENPNEKKYMNCEKAMNAIENIFNKSNVETQASKLLDGSVGGGVAKELYDRLPGHLFYEESVYGFLGCMAIAFIFDDAVYYVAPNFGVKFNSIDEYIQYHQNGQHEFAIENRVDVDELPSWDEYAVFMRNHAKPMIAEIERLNA